MRCADKPKGYPAIDSLGVAVVLTLGAAAALCGALPQAETAGLVVLLAFLLVRRASRRLASSARQVSEFADLLAAAAATGADDPLRIRRGPARSHPSAQG